MDKIIIGVAIVLTVYFFYNLVRIRIKNETNRLNRVYALIVLILSLIIIWNMFRQ